MKILLDENLPRKLVAALRSEGHQVESVHTLRMQGLDNGRLYVFARENFELCFTRDSGFANNVRQAPAPSGFKLLRVTLPQKPQDNFVADFLAVSAPAIGRSFATERIGPKISSVAVRYFEVGRSPRPREDSQSTALRWNGNSGM